MTIAAIAERAGTITPAFADLIFQSVMMRVATEAVRGRLALPSARGSD